MEGAKEMLVRMREEDYASLPYQTRQGFLSEKVLIPNEHKELYETDETYKQLYKDYRKAKKLVEDYKYNKRHAHHRSNT